jgi:hypothetical protein
MTNGVPEISLMKPPCLSTIVIGAAVVIGLLAGGVLASEMGFQVVFTIDGPDGGATSATGTNYLALPYVPRQGLGTARDLWNDLGSNPDILISRHIKATNGFNFYGSATDLPPNGWNLVAGEGYIVKVAQDSTYRILGLHDSTVDVVLIGADNPASLDGTNFLGVPYHTTAANARALYEELGGGDVYISRHIRATDSFNFYGYSTDILPPNGWSLVFGEALIVRVPSDIVYHPSHY